MQQNIQAGSAKVTVVDTINNLHSSTLYHYRLVCCTNNDTIKGADMTFTTLDNPVPTVVTDSATNITAYSVILHGTVNTNGIPCSYYFDYGSTASYGSQSTQKNLDSGLTLLTVSDTILHLQPTTVYHYRIVCSNIYGVGRGDDQSFTTMKDDYFPQTIGSQWLYTFYDAVNLRSDTVEVTITNSGIWQYIAYSGEPGYPTYTESVFVSPTMIQMNSSSSGSRIYLIPFAAGNKWEGLPPQYTFVHYSVSQLDSITTPAGKFY